MIFEVVTLATKINPQTKIYTNNQTNNQPYLPTSCSYIYVCVYINTYIYINLYTIYIKTKEKNYFLGIIINLFQVLINSYKLNYKLYKTIFRWNI